MSQIWHSSRRWNLECLWLWRSLGWLSNPTPPRCWADALLVTPQTRVNAFIHYVLCMKYRIGSVFIQIINTGKINFKLKRVCNNLCISGTKKTMTQIRTWLILPNQVFFMWFFFLFRASAEGSDPAGHITNQTGYSLSFSYSNENTFKNK